MGRRYLSLAIASQIPVPKIISHDEDDIRALCRRRPENTHPEKEYPREPKGHAEVQLAIPLPGLGAYFEHPAYLKAFYQAKQLVI